MTMNGTREPGDGHEDDAVSEETLIMVARIRERAAHIPTAADLAEMTLAAGAQDMSPAEIRQLATKAIDQAQQVSFLLGRLAGLLDEPGGERP